MPGQIAVLEGYQMPRRRRRRSGGSQRAKFSRAAKHCAGRSKGKFKACMRKQLRKRR